MATRIYAVQQCDRMKGWQDVSYFSQWVAAERASLETAQKTGMVTRVIRKPHGFDPPPLPLPTEPVMVYALGETEPVEYQPFDPSWEAERVRRKYEKKASRAASARARIPTWYDRLNQD